jgi:shikimate dehydrogenase
MKRFGLFGFPLGHSFSRKFFTEKFQRDGKPDYVFDNFETQNISDLKQIVHRNPDLVGLSVTTPYKLDIIPMMDNLDAVAQKIGAVNCIKIIRSDDGKFELHGYNTDAWGFELAVRPILRPHHRRALILGTGGSAKAVSFVLRKLNIEHFFVTRNESRFHYTYADLNANTIKAFQIIVNCTPVGMYPNVYNPAQTLFLQKGKDTGAFVHNGFRMLRLQAEKSWEIWNEQVFTPLGAE